MPPEHINWAKVVGELLAEHETAIGGRLPTVAAEALAKTIVPPELAAQVASAVRMLHEAPPPPERNETPPQSLATLVAAEVERQVAAMRRVTGAVITRDGQFVLTYSDGSSERLGLVIGPPGEQGPAGASGPPGTAGRDGDPGPRGRDGVGVTAAAITRDGELALTLSDGTVLTPGPIEVREVA
jgi:hypothetical protein